MRARGETIEAGRTWRCVEGIVYSILALLIAGGAVCRLEGAIWIWLRAIDQSESVIRPFDAVCGQVTGDLNIFAALFDGRSFGSRPAFIVLGPSRWERP